MSILNALIKVGFDNFSQAITNFDPNKEFDKMKKRFDETSKEIEHQIKKMTNHIHNMFDKWVVEMPYDKDTDIITHQIKDNVLHITVLKDGTSNSTKFSTTIPSDVITNSIALKYDSKNKKAIFSFTKKDE